MNITSNEEISSLIRELHWSLKKLKSCQAANKHQQALGEVNLMERKIWKLQQILRDDD